MWKPLPSNYKILQIYTKGLEYALVSSSFEQCHPFVWCKDFLQDVIYSTVNQKAIKIYNFEFNPNQDPNPSMYKVRLLLANTKDKSFANKIPHVLDFINQVEDHLKIKRTTVRRCASPPSGYEKYGVFLFEGNKRWLQAPPMISLYSLLLRVGFSHITGRNFLDTFEGVKSGEIKAYQKKDSTWLAGTDPAFKKILKTGDRKIFHRDIKHNYPKHMTIDSVHNFLGIIGFSSEISWKSKGNSTLVPFWHVGAH